jgi:hypothetical protein
MPQPGALSAPLARALFTMVAERAAALPATGEDERTVLDGYLWLAEYTSWVLEQYLHADPAHPVIMPVVTPFRRFSGDHSLAVYRYVAALDGDSEYHLEHVPGNAAFVSITVHGGDVGGLQATHAVGKLNGDELTYESDGSVRVHLCRTRPAGARNWIPLGDSTNSLLTREFFDDFPPQQQAGRWHIANVSPSRPTRLTDADLAGRLQSALDNLTDAVRRHPRPSDQPVFGTGRVNEFAPFHQFGATNLTGWGNLDAIHTTMPFDTGERDAIIIRGGPPVDCAWWGITLNNRYLASFGAGEPAALPGKRVALDADGTWTAVLADTDPGHPNWLSTAGHRTGVVRIRWLSARRAPSLPTTALTRLPLS